MNRFVADKVKGWADEVTELSRFAESQPHAAYCAFTHGLSSRWLFVSRTVPSDGAVFQTLEDVIRQVFIPARLAVHLPVTVYVNCLLFLLDGVAWVFLFL